MSKENYDYLGFVLMMPIDLPHWIYKPERIRNIVYVTIGKFKNSNLKMKVNLSSGSHVVFIGTRQVFYSYDFKTTIRYLKQQITPYLESV